jgi:hypothetical protein
MSQPGVLYGIGAQKAATTWLYTQLKSHEEVHLPSPKELHYWDTIRSPLSKQFRIMANARAAEAQRFARLGPFQSLFNRFPQPVREERRRFSALLAGESEGHAGYLDYLNRDMRPGTKLLADITPSYALLSQATFREMSQLREGAKFLFILRDPVTRLVSGLRQNLRQEIKSGHVDLTAFRAAFDEAIEMRGAHPAFARSDYATTLARLDGAVADENRHVMFYETMFSPEAVADLSAFLGISPIAAKFKEKVYQTSKEEFVPTPAQMERARTALAAIYDDAARRFGSRVPTAWGVVQAKGAA